MSAFSINRYGARVGPYLIGTARGEEPLGSYEEEETTLFVLKHDFRDVKYRRPWPRWMWPWRSWYVDAKVRKVATKLSWRLKADLRLLALLQEHATDRELDAIMQRFPKP